MLLFVFIVLLVAPIGEILPQTSAPAPDPFSQALALEKAGKLTEAYTILQKEKLRQAHTEHVAKLEAVLRVLEIASLYSEMRQYEMARTALNEQLAKLDPVSDVHLMVAVYKKITAVDAEARQAADEEAEALLTKAATLLEAKKYEEAVTTYRSVVERKPTEISEELIRRARLGQIQAETAQAKAQTAGFGEEITDAMKKGVRTIFQLLIYFAGATVLIFLLVFFRKLIPARNETVIVAEDLTASAEEREARSRSLIREITTEIKSLEKDITGAESINLSEDLNSKGYSEEPESLDGASSTCFGTFVDLSVSSQELAKIESLIQEENPVQIGPFSFSPRQLFSYLRAYFRRPYEFTLLGSLSTQGDHTVLSVEKMTREVKPAPGYRWEARASGEQARSEVIRDVATQIAVQLARVKSTPDWQSLRDYRLAMNCLAEANRATDREKCLERD
jgi:tetratricopeptide (TPR) repeat protein